MCKERIEKAMDTKGVKFASYDVETHQLEIAYNSSKISSEEIHTKLNAVGHDTAKSKASDKQYADIHGCCKYREHGAHGKSSCSGDKKADACCDKDKKKDSCCDKDKKDSCDKKGKDDHDHEDHDEH